MKRLNFLIFFAAVLTLLGALLVKDDFSLRHGFDPQPLTCASEALGSAFDCEAVALSPWAHPGGVSLAGLGMAFGFWLLCLSFLLLKSSGNALLRNVIIGSSIFGALVSAATFIIMLTQIGKLCPFCIAYDVFMWSYAATALSLLAPKSDLTSDPGQTQLMKKRLLTSLILTAILVVMVPLIHLYKDRANRAMDAQFIEQWKTKQTVNIPFDDFDPVMGPADAPVQVVVFSDFECPHCAAAAFQLDRLMKQHPREVSVRYKHFPLSSDCNAAISSPGHRNACQRSFWAQCAQQQGHFKELHDSLFRLQTGTITADTIKEWSPKMGLSAEELLTCGERPETIQKIRIHAGQGESLGVNGTPKIYINNKDFDYMPTLNNLNIALKYELSHK